MAKVTTESIPLSVLGKFPDDWDESTLEDVCTQVTDGTHDSPKPVVNGGYPLVTGKAIKNRQIDFSVTYNISDEDHQKVISRSKANIDDILFSNIGNSIGDLVRVNTTAAFSIKNVALFKPDQSKVTPRFLEYYLLSELVQNFIKSSTRGSAQPFIGLGSLRGFPIALPPLGEQVEIGSLLGALDDRIALLRETNATLEAIAQALFKSWFVDFDPVHAKARGESPQGMDDATAALFPDSFEESELGMIPTGWRVVPFGQLLSHTIGGDWGDEIPNEKNDTQVAIIRGTDMPDLQSGMMNRVPIRYTSQKKLASRKLQDGDLVLEVSGGSKDQPTGRSLYMTNGLLSQFDCPVEPASFCRLLRPAEPRQGLLLAQHLIYIYADGKTWQYQNQSTGIANFQTTHFLETELVVVPSEEILDSFSATVRPMIDRSHLTQISQLAALRDTLLPKLISGQLRLPEAQVLLAEELP